MNVLRGLRFATDTPAAKAAASGPALPEVNTFVEIAINGKRQRESVAVNEVSAQALFTRTPAGVRAGDSADFVYTNDSGRFRFTTVCTQSDGREAAFALPAEIRTLESFANRRRAPRVPWLGPAQWRFAPGGQGYGEFLPASMMDVSSSGASIVVSSQLKAGAQVEVRFILESKDRRLAAVSEVVRTQRLEKSHKNAAGIRFVDIDADARRILGEFVVDQQTARRDRGVV